MKSPNFYKLLQVSEEADVDVIDAAYRRLALKYHPDRNFDPAAAKVMSQLNEAYHVLSNRARREAYDKSLADEQMQGDKICHDAERRSEPEAKTESARDETPAQACTKRVPAYVLLKDGASAGFTACAFVLICGVVLATVAGFWPPFRFIAYAILILAGLLSP